MDPAAIRARTRRAAADLGIAIADHLPLIDAFELRAPDARFERLCALHAAVAGAFGLDRGLALRWCEAEGVAAALTAAEREYLRTGRGGLGLRDRVESLWALAWSLGLVDALDPRSRCASDFVRVLPDPRAGAGSAPLRGRVSPRAADVIADQLDLHYALHWAVREGRIALAWIAMRRHALEWCACEDDWDDVSLET